jgi:glycosyltransferase involved in cell wall biosynthesis
MSNQKTMEVSIIIPVFTGHENLQYLLPAINQQTLPPSEIIIVDSCSHTEVEELIDNIHIEIPIHYHREDKRAFPGKARNIGVSIAKHEYIAFLDCRTIPSNNWLHHYSQLIQENDVGMIAGSIKVSVHTKFQWYMREASYGKRLYAHVPGTLMEKALFENTGGFVENLRMAEDVEWFQRLQKDRIEFVSIATPFLEYDGLPKSLFSACLKYLQSGYYTSFVMEDFKNLLTSALLMAAILIIPRWNFMLDGWDSNSFFIPNVTKIFFLILISILLIWRFIYFLIPRELPDNIFVLSIKLAVLGMVTVSVYNWNASMAFWIEDAVLYIPHITKIYVGILLGLVFIYRGLIKPMKNKTSARELLPYKWFFVGILGLSMDIVKIPGTILGSIIGRLKQLASFGDTATGK